MVDNGAGLIEAFITFKRSNQGRAASTERSYSAHLRRLGEFLEARGQSLASATHDDLGEFTGAHLHQLGVTPRGRRPAIAAVREFYRWLQRSRRRRDNPAQYLVYPSIGRKLPNALTRRHLEAIFLEADLKTFRGIRDTAILGVLAGCGLRVSGVVRLTEEDIVLERAENGGEAAFLRVTEKGNRDRLVPMPDDAWLMLRAYLGHPELEAIERTLPDGRHVLFVNLRNRSVPAHEAFGEARRLSANGVRRMVVRYGRAAGVPREYLHPHAFRHSYGTELAEAGVDLLLRQALMGHAKADSTRIYDHMALHRLRKAAFQGNPLRHVNTPFRQLRDTLRPSVQPPKG